MQFCWNSTFLTKYLMIFSIIITYFNKKKMALDFLYFLAVMWIDSRIIMLQHCVFKIKMAFELDNFYKCMCICVSNFSVWYFDTKNYCYLFPHHLLILKHVFVCIIYNMLYKINFVFLILFTWWINVSFFCCFRCFKFNCICKVLQYSEKSTKIGNEFRYVS